MELNLYFTMGVILSWIVKIFRKIWKTATAHIPAVPEKGSAANASSTTPGCASCRPASFPTMPNAPMTAAMSILPGWFRKNAYNINP